MLQHSFEIRFDYLYRKHALVVFAACATLLATAFLLHPELVHAQRKKNSGPRALGVVVWNGDSPKPNKTTSVLMPIAILVEGRYYDANLYQAQPDPLAVDAGVVYDVLQSGDSMGTFTIGGARTRDSLWYGTGLFEPKEGPKPAPATSNPRTTASPDEDDRPKLRRGTPPPPAPKAQTDAVLQTIDRDPERPTLRRQTAEERKAKEHAAKPPEEFIPPQLHSLVAVSDAGAGESRSFSFRSKPGEVDELRAKMETLARAELNKQSQAPVPQKPKSAAGKSERAQGQPSRPVIQLQDAKFGVFDVNSNNAPILVYSAAVMIDGAKKYITVAAWEEIDESLRRVFANITDDRHLDIYPRLEVIDAVDSSGNGRGELLFRAYGDQGTRFILYHPGPDSLNVLFDTARGAS